MRSVGFLCVAAACQPLVPYLVRGVFVHTVQLPSSRQFGEANVPGPTWCPVRSTATPYG